MTSAANTLNKNRWMLLLLLLAFVLRVGAAVYWHRSALPENGFLRLGDSDGYWVLASHIAQGEPYQYGSENASVFRAPMMPLLLSPMTLIEDRSTAIFCARIVGALLGTLSVYLVSLLAFRLAGRQAALAAALLASLYPSAIGVSIIILSEMLFMPLMLTFLLLWSDTLQASTAKQRVRLALLTGIVGGLAILTRPSWLLFTPMVAVLGVGLVRRRMDYVQTILWMGLGISIAMMPWWVRNYNVTGKFVLTTLQVGPSLYDSFHPGASGGSDEGMNFMRRIESEQTEADQRSSQLGEGKSQALEGTLDGTFEWRINRRAQQQAIDWCLENPLETPRLAFAKLKKTWSVWPDGGDVGSPLIRAAVSLSMLTVMLLAFFGSWKLFRTQTLMLAICWSPCLYFTLLHMVFVGSVRYREPAVIVLLAVAGCSLARWFFPQDSSVQDSSRVEFAKPDRSTG